LGTSYHDQTVPEFYRRNDEGGYTVVCRQPVTEEEILRAEEGKSACPTDSIGNDGLAGGSPEGKMELGTVGERSQV
jgi:hypothetical protein